MYVKRSIQRPVIIIALIFLFIGPYFVNSLSARVPVVLYHAHHDGAFGFSEPMFREHMEFLKDNDYTPITLDQLLDWREFDNPLPLRPIVLTFDDNYTGMKTVVAPIMREMEFVGINFAHTDYVGWIPPGDVQRPTWDDLTGWEAEGILLTESHTVTHRDLTALYNNDVIDELVDSRAAIEENIPDKECLYLAYPYGRYNTFVIEQMELAGYRAGFTTVRQHATRHSKLMEIPRIGVDNTGLSTFIDRIGYHDLPQDPPGKGWSLNVDTPHFILEPEGWNTISGVSQSFGNHIYIAENALEKAGWKLYLDDGYYHLYAWWPNDSSYATNSSFLIEDHEQEHTVYVDQSTKGGEWNLLGHYYFSSDKPASIRLGTEANGTIVADGLWIEPVPETYIEDWHIY